MLNADSLILNSENYPLAPVRRYILGRTERTPYSNVTVEALLWMYKEVCTASGVNLELVLTQVVHETGALTSYWSQVPRRNPAGIGVTGEPGKGIWFDSWTESVSAHVGRLLAYRFDVGQGTPYQQRLINTAVSYRPSPRNVGDTLADLATRWAADPDYVTKMIRVSKNIEEA